MWRMPVRGVAIAAVLSVLVGWGTTQPGTQDAPSGTRPGPLARIVVLQPKPGRATEFAEGYKRHLAWHRSNKDPWTWYGWTFVLGDRLGQFMDGTFGHSLTDFDHAIDPAGDAADNKVNVLPNADFATHGVWERLERASVGAALPDASPYLVLNTYLVEAGRESAFETAIAKLAGRSDGQRMSWYKLRVGGELPQYLLMRSARTFSDGVLPDVVLPPGLVRSARSELLRFQSDLSYIP